MENNRRVKEHKRNFELELILNKLSDSLSGINLSYKDTPDLPTVFIMGCARSGTTLLSQLIASVPQFTYPSNLISRFYYNVHLGSMIQKMLNDLDDKDELLNCYAKEIKLISNLGKTNGPLAPHEFWYFWRKNLPFHDKFSIIKENELSEKNIADFRKGIYAFHEVFNKPLVMKGMICNWSIPLLKSLIPNSYFIFIERDIRYNAQSLLKSRKDFFGSIEEWYSFKPLEYDDLIKTNPYRQVVGQVHFTNKAIREGLKSINEDCSLHIKYEDLCHDPERWINNIINLLPGDIDMPKIKDLTQMSISEKVSIKQEEWEKIEMYAHEYGYGH